MQIIAGTYRLSINVIRDLRFLIIASFVRFHFTPVVSNHTHRWDEKERICEHFSLNNADQNHPP